jgi:hypothetical protein
MLLNLGLNNEKCIHTIPLRSVPFHISPSLSLPLQSLPLFSLVSLSTKTKRIAERSAIVTHTHRQSTLEKYMIECSFLKSFPNLAISFSIPQRPAISWIHDLLFYAVLTSFFYLFSESLISQKEEKCNNFAV